MDKKNYDIAICVTNDLNSDQRMMRIAESYQNSNKEVLLIGHINTNSQKLIKKKYDQIRIRTIFGKGPLFYAEFNIRILFKLLGISIVRLYSVDLDTILGVGVASICRKIPFIFDSHEYFTELPELEKKPLKRLCWSYIAKWGIRKASFCMTVGSELARILLSKYGKDFSIIYNYPKAKPLIKKDSVSETFRIIYQGKINKGRGVEEILEALRELPEVELWIVGDGDLFPDVTNYVKTLDYKERIKLFGWIHPDKIHNLTCQCNLGLNLLNPSSKNYFYSAANKYYDYIMAGIPVLTMNFPEYAKANEKFDVAYLLNDLKIQGIISCIQSILNDKTSFNQKINNCFLARKAYNWNTQISKLPFIN